MSEDSRITITVSTKGRIVLPKSICRAQDWKAGTRLLVENGPDGVLLRVVPHFPETRPEQVFGCLSYEGEAKSVAEMDAGIMAEATRSRFNN
ncbi:MAG: AbrB/MazE/SpoVT family DNA-binding domain-containing protein [Gammaproteobacteria bacterium]|nr:AbrB/MazE/SpoVT family DNA-binding domain-containing protein [Gammaproteobacteria bacterium]MYA36985.1 AbrB/MazE/SpoVT family DNA-binding domain-containing protein [Gammaproteobacteria bacterium]MYG96717.1 AbrB/MazE/SpoVT family DNA-binding domain-containing protein [Gammaproteobacteria bacterium]MYH85595.1 AbrB/MazE/SpoVT family DNA-binding domain-containing protein [Gammaproteobacteria bacterium]MYK04897.1 AbrB/MazE/SpoVT family DNA-binding domain-containing protein [Gammaproteobacteria ba